MKSKDLSENTLENKDITIFAYKLREKRHLWLFFNHYMSKPVRIIHNEKNIFNRAGPNFSESK